MVEWMVETKVDHLGQMKAGHLAVQKAGCLADPMVALTVVEMVEN